MSRIIAPVAIVIAILSLLLNVLIIEKLSQVRVSAIAGLDRASTALNDLPGVTLRHTVHISQEISVGGVLPLHEAITVPINANVPIKTTTQVSVGTAFGPVGVPVTVDTNVPIDIQVPVLLSRTLPYSLSVPIDLDVPLEIRVGDLGIQSGIDQLQNEIQKIRDSLR